MYIYRIVVEEVKNGEFHYLVQRKRKGILPWWKWRDCKVEVFYGAGSAIYRARFSTIEEAQKYIEHKGSMVNALIPGHSFYTE